MSTFSSIVSVLGALVDFDMTHTCIRPETNSTQLFIRKKKHPNKVNAACKNHYNQVQMAVVNSPDAESIFALPRASNALPDQVGARQQCVEVLLRILTAHFAHKPVYSNNSTHR